MKINLNEMIDVFKVQCRCERLKRGGGTEIIYEDEILIINNFEENSCQILPKGFVQELILLVDMRIRKEHKMQNKLTLIGYAYCLSALLGDPKSYYYEFMLRYYACIDKFITGRYQDVSISISVNANKYFKNITSKL